MEIILELLLELILQSFGELIFDLGFRTMGGSVRRRRFRNPWLAGIGSFFLGAIAGFLSLLVFKDSFLKQEALRIANLIITPLIAGYMMWLIGRWRTKRNQNTIRLESFWQGFAFALGMAIIRFVFFTRP